MSTQDRRREENFIAPEKSLAKVFFSVDIFSFLANANFFLSSCAGFSGGRNFLPVVDETEEEESKL